VEVFGNADAPFPLKNPGADLDAAGVRGGIIVSLLGREPDPEERYAEAERRIHLGAPAPPAPAATRPAFPADR
jgi:cation/acetate symporter